MAERKVVSAPTAKNKKEVKKAPGLPLFEKENYVWMGIGAIVIALGMILMAGGKNDDPNTFDTSKVYGFTRITVAPILIIIGLLIEIYAIFKRPRAHQQ